MLKLQRTGVDTPVGNWVTTQLEGATNGFVDGPYQDTNVDDIYFTPTATTGSISVNATNAAGANVFHFTKKDIGRVIRLEDPAEGHKVISFTKAGASSKNGALVRA